MQRHISHASLWWIQAYLDHDLPRRNSLWGILMRFQSVVLMQQAVLTLFSCACDHDSSQYVWNV